MGKMNTPSFKNDDFLYKRPVTRADCVGQFRPCPYSTCRHHLIHAYNKNDIKNITEDDILSLPETCVLDVVDDNQFGLTLLEIGNLLGVTRERARQLIADAVISYNIEAFQQDIVLLDFLDES